MADDELGVDINHEFCICSSTIGASPADAQTMLDEAIASHTTRIEIHGLKADQK